jgi:DNA polymerase-3 subunit alpha
LNNILQESRVQLVAKGVKRCHNEGCYGRCARQSFRLREDSLSEFVHLHVHSDYSLLDGLGRIPLLVQQAHEQRMPALALTDHGVMFGVVDFYEQAAAAGLKPIIGFEAYVSDRPQHERGGEIYHLTLLAENEIGYRNLMQLTTKAHLTGFYRKPRVDHELLAQHNEGVICLSGCASSEIARAILDGNLESAQELADWYRTIYSGRFYLELQHHGLDFQKRLNEGLLHLHTTMGIPVVATNDVHYVRREHAVIHEVLLCVQTQTTLTDEKRMRFGSQEFYLKSAEEMESLFGHVPTALSNTLAIAERCNLELNFGRLQLPCPPIPTGLTPEKYLRQLCEAGIHSRYGAEITDTIRQRLEYELDIIEKTGYVNYFLLVNDFIQFARQRGIGIGVRGSAGGSIVAYALKITSIDPLAHGLSFERFLNPERVSMPDVDIDIADDRRDEVIRYVTERFGRDHVAQIITFGTFAARAAVRDVGRAQGLPLAHIDHIAKLIPFQADLAEALASVPELRSLYNGDPIIRTVIDTARELEGIARHASTHAAGVVISADPLAAHVPLFKLPKSEVVTTQYAMGPLEKLGLLKMDFLGLRTLTVLQRATKLVEQVTGEPIDIESLPLDDPATFDLLARGETFGVFQVDGVGMRRLLRELRPNRFEDIVALIALYRPGPMQFIDEFVRRRNGMAPITYPHPSMESALAETYGIPVYQEQVVRMVVEIAGFSAGKADIVRKAMGKKQPELMAKYRADFVAGAMAKGTAPTVAEQLFDIIQEFSGYGFNKAHSAAYAVVTYHTAYLKAHYPAPYMAAYLSAERENSEKVAEALNECRRLKIPVLPPDVNRSELDFSLEDGAIRYGLGAIKNLGTNAAEGIIAERRERGPFTSIGDFCRRLDQRLVNKRALESLIKCGALDSLGERGQLLVNLDRLVAFGARAAREAASGQVSLFADSAQETVDLHLQPCSPADLRQRLAWEKELIGTYLSEHPLERAMDHLHRLGAQPLGEIDNTFEGQVVTVGGSISAVRTFTTRKGEQMAAIQLSDLEASIEVVVYPRVYSHYRELIAPDTVVVIAGMVGVREDHIEVRADSIVSLEAAVRAQPSELKMGGDTAENRQPIPFRRPEMSKSLLREPSKLIIDFVRSADRAGDLRRIVAIYEAILRYPGTDQVVLMVRTGTHAHPLNLPIDTAQVSPALYTELQKIAPDISFREEQIGA